MTTQTEPTMIPKDHDLLVRLDEKVDQIGRVLDALNKSLDARGQAIDDLKTSSLLHQQETKTQWTKIDDLNARVTSLETNLSAHDKVVDAKIVDLEQGSITRWAQKHPKVAYTLGGVFLIMLNFHDIIVPYALAALGIKTP